MVNKRKSLEKLYDDTCNIYEFEKVKNLETKRFTSEPFLKFENIPCRISFKNISQAQEGTGFLAVSQVTVLFINSEISIKEGSLIEVIRQEKRMKYKCSGIPAIYSSHQEIILSTYKEKS